ncbi:hypothetical protein NIES2135_05060 [Leptolyngbya boryana NIES-2135]|jgi:hypothetical protein|uniref:Uncharacterized protein n=1 Tax=Leptolyngbya boryana NIES-2135 TaxID=1973484 RepID=A0A1Z4JAB6_LEPBY|nr:MULTISPECIES: hypothetical protein [Leptolyngbya]BAY53696.1 hypothetical protein NIES2135_05060 [Leptolyngbya boryana NIES-2135]MBD2367865.1 hypothetical protein [Leptolyngbya sp. FACHB-161]MBD2374287.1 hypothetical protein [Leptolyngbya sp. FACHB-238]MBD2398509.1 hypothetical protein [Leptolyngbya sp. FACHB-239]MBD2408323.1 hypothetical protein [Leptolyngbya sp. FACHB-402]
MAEQKPAQVPPAVLRLNPEREQALQDQIAQAEAQGDVEFAAFLREIIRASQAEYLKAILNWEGGDNGNT